MPNMGAPELLILAVIWIVPAVIVAWLAAKKGYSAAVWAVLGTPLHLGRAHHRARPAAAPGEPPAGGGPAGG